ncbi:hypothetical protein [Phenylobacterium sp.]|uniref:hypothetical protein n=1 Tax=Phenylobacterium sp. TaxID=1871053 RepID=UPI002DF1410E|nr:hypothetical protein [Phenylobacterium sp.]
MQPDLLRRIAQGWVALGLLVFLFDAFFAVSHYVFGQAVHDRYSGELASSSQVAAVTVALGLGSALFAVLGGVYLWFHRDR